MELCVRGEWEHRTTREVQTRGVFCAKRKPEKHRMRIPCSCDHVSDDGPI